MNGFCPCYGSELQNRQKQSCLNQNLIRKQEDSVDASELANQEIRSLLRRIFGDSLEFCREILLR